MGIFKNSATTCSSGNICHLEIDAWVSKLLVGVSVFCFCVLVRISFLWEQREWPIGLSDQCPCLREERREKGWQKQWRPFAVRWVGFLMCWEEMGFLKLTSRNSKNIVSWAGSSQGLPRASSLSTTDACSTWNTLVCFGWRLESWYCWRAYRLLAVSVMHIDKQSDL
jgi:hypothetical protein